MTEYNGWTNWQTWQVPLWIDNDEYMYKVRARETDWTAGRVEEFTRDMLPEGTPDMESDTDYNGVNWQEIADAWNSEE